MDVRDRQAEDGAHVQGELGEILRDEGDQPGVMGARRHLAEDDVVALDEELDPEQAAATERLGDLAGHVLGGGQRLVRHRMRLPGLAVVALDLGVTDRCAEAGAAGVADRQHRDLVVEIDEALDDDLALAGTATLLGVVPGGLDVGGGFDQALALAGAAHDRLDHAGQANLVDRRAEFLLGLGEDVGRGLQAEVLGGQPADALAVHRQPGRARGRHDGKTLVLQLDQGFGGDGFDLGDEQVGFLHLDQPAQGLAVEHGDDMAAVRHLHGGRVGVAVDGDHLDAKALQFDDDLLAEFPGAEEHGFGGGGRERGADAGHARSYEPKSALGNPKVADSALS